MWTNGTATFGCTSLPVWELSWGKQKMDAGGVEPTGFAMGESLKLGIRMFLEKIMVLRWKFKVFVFI